MKRLLSSILDCFNSVVLGISLMLLIAIYIAVGSGLPKVRAFFECTDLEFFNAWPLKLLMLLLVLSLSVVTIKRIPLTPPRYGVWCVHVGIVVLVLGMAKYYRDKVEGSVRIALDQTADHFYDAAERSLHVKINDMEAASHRLESLPRYEVRSDNTFWGRRWWFNASDLEQIRPHMNIRQSGEVVRKPVSEVFKLPHDLNIRVTGFWPWAVIQKAYVEDATGTDRGVRLRFELPEGHSADDGHNHGPIPDRFLVGSSSSDARRMLAGAELEHRIGGPEAAKLYEAAARQIHRVQVKLKDHSEILSVEPGKAYDIGASGYRLTIENYVPNWSMNETQERVRALVLMVKSPTTEFRRMILAGKDVQTDFLLNAEGAGPMGARQTAPIDKDLVLNYTFDDQWRLTSPQGSEKHTLITSDDGSLTDIVVSNAAAVQVNRFADGKGFVEIDTAASAGPFMRAMAQKSGGEKMKVKIERVDHLKPEESVAIVPMMQRSMDLEQRCVYNVVRAEVSMGDWKRTVLVPFTEEAGDNPWQVDPIPLPGTRHSLSLTLSKTMLPLPAKITLKRFDLVPYPGGDPSPSSLMRDFRSTIQVENPETGEKLVDVAQMNNPVYYDGGRWLFFQAQWDPEGQKWTVLGIGNRPGVYVMIAGCVMIFIGLMYAFYVKPVIIRKMKQKALAEASRKKAKVEAGALV